MEGDDKLVRTQEITLERVRTMLEHNQASLPDFLALGPPVIPPLFESLAISVDNSEGILALVCLVILCGLHETSPPRVDIEYPRDRAKVLLWGRENRYLADWLCPECHMGYDVHINRPCISSEDLATHQWKLNEDNLEKLLKLRMELP